MRIGLQVHLHAIGDAIVTAALDAIQFAQNKNASWDRRPVIADAILSPPGHIARRQELGVTAIFEPFGHNVLMSLCRELLHFSVSREPTGNTSFARFVLHWRKSRLGAARTFRHRIGVSPSPLRLLAEILLLRKLSSSHLRGVAVSTALETYAGGTSYKGLANLSGALWSGSVADAMWISPDPSERDTSWIPAIEIKGTRINGRASKYCGRVQVRDH